MPAAVAPLELKLSDDQVEKLLAHNLVAPAGREVIAGIRQRPGKRPTLVVGVISPEAAGALEEVLLAEREGRDRVLTPSAEARRLRRAGFSVPEISRTLAKPRRAVEGYLLGVQAPKIAELPANANPFLDAGQLMSDAVRKAS